MRKRLLIRRQARARGDPSGQKRPRVARMWRTSARYGVCHAGCTAIVRRARVENLRPIRGVSCRMYGDRARRAHVETLWGTAAVDFLWIRGSCDLSTGMNAVDRRGLPRDAREPSCLRCVDYRMSTQASTVSVLKQLSLFRYRMVAPSSPLSSTVRSYSPATTLSPAAPVMSPLTRATAA